MALSEMGYNGADGFEKWRNNERSILQSICVGYGWKIKHKEKSKGSLAVDKFKAEKDKLQADRDKLNADHAELKRHKDNLDSIINERVEKRTRIIADNATAVVEQKCIEYQAKFETQFALNKSDLKAFVKTKEDVPIPPVKPKEIEPEY